MFTCSQISSLFCHTGWVMTPECLLNYLYRLSCIDMYWGNC